MSKAVTEMQKEQARERSRFWRAQRVSQDPDGFRAAEAQRIAERRARQKAGEDLPTRPGAQGPRPRKIMTPLAVLVVETPVFLSVLPVVDAIAAIVAAEEAPAIVSIAPVEETPPEAVAEPDTEPRRIPSVMERMRSKNGGNLRNRRYG